MELIELSGKERLVIRAGRLFDGTGAPVTQDVRVYVVEGKVRFIESGWPEGGRALGPVGRRARGFKEIGGEEFTLLPGLIDCHVHLAFDGRDFHNARDLWKRPSALWPRIQNDLSNILSHGVVAVRDGGDSAGIALRCRDGIINGRLRGPILLISGMALRKRDKYGSFLGPGVPAEELAATVGELAGQGVDQIKVIASGVASFQEYGRVGQVQFTAEELREIVKVADAYGLKVMAHASSDEAVRNCIEAGVHSVEHGYFISADSLRALADRGIAWVPTLIPVAAQLRGKLRERHTPERLAVIEKTFRRQLEMVALAGELGVRLGAGSDAGAAGVLHGSGLLEELQLLREAGLDTGRILLSATGTAADILGKKDRLGVVRPGRPAFLLLVRGNPLGDIGEITKIACVIRPEPRPADLTGVEAVWI